MWLKMHPFGDEALRTRHSGCKSVGNRLLCWSAEVARLSTSSRRSSAQSFVRLHKYKDSREQFEKCVHKRLISIIGPTQKTVTTFSGGLSSTV